MDKYPVSEIFKSIQGEGIFAGTPCTFIRLWGCPVKCSWCDTDYTWRSNVIDCVKWMTIDEIMAEVTDVPVRHVVITGGEPTIYNLDELLHALHQFGYITQLETSGLKWLGTEVPYYITISPKENLGFEVNESLLKNAIEIKFVVDDRLQDFTVEQFIDIRSRVYIPGTGKCPIVLMPEGAPPTKESTQRALDMVTRISSSHRFANIRYGGRLQWQLGIR